MSGDRWTMEDLATLPADVRRQIEQKLLLVNSQRALVNGHRQESNHQQMLDALEAPWPGKEKVLQAACERVLRCSGWQFFHMPGHAAIGNPCGWPDLIAFGPGQRVLLIELKTARGVVSDRQKKTFDALAALGWTVHICRNARHVEWLIKYNEERL